MLFNSLTFIQFFVIVLALHHLPLPWNVRKFNLLIASYLFYAAWNPPFVILIWFSTLIDWYAARAMGRATTQGRKRTLLMVSLTCNLGLLGFFKYGGFVLENFTELVHLAGFDYTPAAPNIILPVGISFYTFQTLSYTLDVYKGRTKPWDSFLDFALFVTFFPQLVAGPIVRAVDFLPQCLKPRRANGQQFAWGISLLVIGLFEKVCIADALLAPIADKAFDGAGHLPPMDAWAGALAFSGQIFCDFAGYSTCAIGVALCLGFAIQDNFRFPYGAVGFSDFWRRWHISLSSWLRDYLYISLGGNRQSGARTQVNLMLTMLLGGLWHGANWTFVAWGGLHGLFLVIERQAKNLFGAWPVWQRWPAQLVLGLVTYVAVVFTWVFFRAPDFSTAGKMIAHMTALPIGPTWGEVKTIEIVMVFGVTAIMLALHAFLRNRSVEWLADRIPWWLRSIALAGMLLAVITMAGDDRAFIYFQF